MRPLTPLLILAVLATACTTVKAELDVKVDAIASPGGGVLLVGSAVSCKKFNLDVKRKAKIFALSATGSIPRVDGNNYCEKYIDTGGTGPKREYANRKVDIAPGRYTVRARKGGDQVEFVYRDGVVATSRLVNAQLPNIDAVAEELAWQSKATVATAARLETLLATWTLDECTQATGRSHLTECRFTSAPGYVPRDGTAGLPLLPAETLAAVPCSGEPGARGGTACALGEVNGRQATLHAERPSYNMTTRAAHVVTWVTSGS